jgi:hypothetical protein
MSDKTRGERGEAREELRSDRRKEYLLLVQAVIALAVIAVILVVRQVYFA